MTKQITVDLHPIEREEGANLVIAHSNQIPVHDKGFIRLDVALASDLDPVNAARVSFGESQNEMDAKAEGLVRFLVENSHGSPFEHAYFRWHVKAPIFVFREWHRHRAGWSYNEMSGRYKELPREFYIPHRDRVRHQVGKPGAYTFERVEDDELAAEMVRDLHEACDAAFDTYEQFLRDGVAKEIARCALPVNTYSEMYASCNPRSLMHFLGLRNSEDAQYEIRAYAEVMEEILASVMPVTHRTFIKNDRVSP